MPCHRRLPGHSTILLFTADAMVHGLYHFTQQPGVLEVKAVVYSKSLLHVWCVFRHSNVVKMRELILPGMMYYSAVALSNTTTLHSQFPAFFTVSCCSISGPELNAIKDKIFRKALMWVPTGDSKAHKSNKYRNMRILCWLWTLTILGGLISAVTYRIVVDKFMWYNCLPLIILNVYNFYLAHPFLFYMG